MSWKEEHSDRWIKNLETPTQSTSGVWDNGYPRPPKEHVYENGSCIYCGHAHE